MIKDSQPPSADSADSDSPVLPPGLKVLVVEDNRANQMVAQVLLRKMGCAATIAGDGKEALEAVEGGDFDIILMDCMMPVMDGFEATKAIRQLAGGKNRIPIIAMTARTQPGDTEICLEAGMDAVVAKPISKKILLETLADYCVDTPEETSSSPETGATPAGFLLQANPAGGFSDAALLRRMEGDSRLAREVAGLFIIDMREQLQKIQEFLGMNKAKEAAKVAHSLAGSASSIGAKTLADLAKGLEQNLTMRGDHQNLSHIDPAIEALFAKVFSMTLAVLEILDHFKGPKPAAPENLP
jgi:CheY-like chemotaxis protein